MSNRPMLVVMVGAPATGKSYLARQLAQALDAALVQTDAIRKQRFKEPRYTPGEHFVVYRIAHDRIRRLLGQGRAVVFDATNLLEDRRREVYALADEAGAPVVIVWTRASDAVVAQRLGWRKAGRDPSDISDATWQVYRQMQRRMDPIPRPHFVVNTSVRLGPALAHILRSALAAIRAG